MLLRNDSTKRALMTYPIHRLTLCAALVASLAAPVAASAADEPGKPNPVTTAVAKAVGKVRADDDMLAVLKAHASLNPKAIEKLDVATARNVTPAQATSFTEICARGFTHLRS